MPTWLPGSKVPSTVFIYAAQLEPGCAVLRRSCKRIRIFRILAGLNSKIPEKMQGKSVYGLTPGLLRDRIWR